MVTTIRCECGALINGISEDHCKINITNHKKSKKHKELMEIKSFDLKKISKEIVA